MCGTNRQKQKWGQETGEKGTGNDCMCTRQRRERGKQKRTKQNKEARKERGKQQRRGGEEQKATHLSIIKLTEKRRLFFV